MYSYSMKVNHFHKMNIQKRLENNEISSSIKHETLLYGEIKLFAVLELHQFKHPMINSLMLELWIEGSTETFHGIFHSYYGSVWLKRF